MDFADDIFLLKNTQEGTREFTYKMQDEAAKLALHMNPDECKIMKIGKWKDTGGITVGGNKIEMVDAFCYLTDDSRCDKEIRARIEKANAVFGRMERICKSNGCGPRLDYTRQWYSARCYIAFI